MNRSIRVVAATRRLFQEKEALAILTAGVKEDENGKLRKNGKFVKASDIEAFFKSKAKHEEVIDDCERNIRRLRAMGI